MKLYIDEDSVHGLLVRFLQHAGHDVEVPLDVGLVGKSDPVHLSHAIDSNRPLLSRNYDDFEELHELILTSGGAHPGILIVRRDNDRRRDLTPRGIVTAISLVVAADVPVENEFIHSQPLAIAVATGGPPVETAGVKPLRLCRSCAVLPSTVGRPKIVTEIEAPTCYSPFAIVRLLFEILIKSRNPHGQRLAWPKPQDSARSPCAKARRIDLSVDAQYTGGEFCAPTNEPRGIC